MTAAREQLEAMIWARAPELLCGDKNCQETAMDDILAAVDAYAAGDGEALAEARRAVLHRESRP